MKNIFSPLAQRLERLSDKQKVMSSILMGATILIGCTPASEASVTVKPFQDIDNRKCFFIEGTYSSLIPSGIYCKVDVTQ